MISRYYAYNDTESIAVYSNCERYRYKLSRVWENKKQTAMFVMLNPSTATEKKNDPTVERCERRARLLGFGAFIVTNIFAWRDTDPQKMRAAADPVGPANDKEILKCAADSDKIIAAWGTHGAFLQRGSRVECLLRSNGFDLFHLGLSQGGQPRHPLYIAYEQKLELWQR
ncbi:MAG: DUF1643 domain-containing protein [Aestuariivita sp.]|nr:DUF1643 domain-containing protein [Aestuariivita sp.]